MQTDEGEHSPNRKTTSNEFLLFVLIEYKETKSYRYNQN